MENTLLNRQIIDARNNLNYFFGIIIIKICKFIFKLSICLIINGFITLLPINIICLFYSIYSMYNICKEVDCYIYIIKDIENTLSLDSLYFTIDVNFLKNNFFNKRIDYGK